MKLFFEFFPILLFFITYKLGDIYLATIAAIVASCIQVLYGRYAKGKFEIIPLCTLGAIVLLGSATLLLRNELFIKWKPTAIYWLLASVFLASHWIGQKTLIQRLAENNISLKSRVWFQLNMSWVLFFVGMGIANLYVVYHYDTNTWVNFKLFGTLGLTLLFIIAQGIYMTKHHLHEQKSKSEI